MWITDLFDKLFTKQTQSPKESEPPQTETGSGEGSLFTDGPSKENIIAGKIFDAVEGLGTDEQALQEALIGVSEEEGKKISSYYRSKDGKSIEDVIKADTSGRLEERLLSALKGETEINPDDAPESMDVETAKEVAKKLYEALNYSTWYSFGFGTDEEAIWESFQDLSEEQITYIEKIYKLVYDEDLKERLNRELSGEDQEKLDSIYENAKTQTPATEPTEDTEEPRNDNDTEYDFEMPDFMDPAEIKELLSSTNSFQELYDSGVLNDDDINYFSSLDKESINKIAEVLNTQNIAALMKNYGELSADTLCGISTLEEEDFKHTIDIIDSDLITALLENESYFTGEIVAAALRNSPVTFRSSSGGDREVPPPSKELLSSLYNSENLINYLTDENGKISDDKALEVLCATDFEPESLEALISIFNNAENNEFFNKPDSYNYSLLNLINMSNNSVIEDREPITNKIQDFFNNLEIDLDIKPTDFPDCTNEELENILECLKAIETLEYSFYLETYNKSALSKLKDANPNYIKELDSRQTWLLHDIVTNNEYGIAYDLMFLYGDEQFDVMNKALFGDPVDQSLANELSRFEEKYGITIKSQNNISIDPNNKDASIYLTQEWLDSIDSALQTMKDKGIDLPKEIYFTEFSESSNAAGVFMNSNPDAIIINVGKILNESYVQTTVIHETGHMNDYIGGNFTSGTNIENVGLTKRDEREKIEEMKFDMNGKEVILTDDEITKLVRDYATTNVHEFVAEVSTLFGLGAIYKDENGNYQVDTSKTARVYMRDWQGTEEDYEILEKIIAAYDILTEGSRNDYRG